jgi:hypothetical protein
MSVLQLTPAEYAEYKSHNASDTMYKQLALEKGPSPKLLRVVGFNEDTKTVFRACNPAGNDYIEVPWDMIDSVASICFSLAIPDRDIWGTRNGSRNAWRTRYACRCITG